MRYLALLVNGEIVDQIPTNLSNEEIIDLDEMLRKNNIYKEDIELASVEDL